MNKKISVFLPTRKGSQRVKNKNTRPFADINGGLLALKLTQLLKVKYIDEVILSTNDDASIEVANIIINNSESKLKVVKRPDQLALDTTDLSELIKYAPSVCTFPNILWTHVTSPFTKTIDYENAIISYFNQLNYGYDSLMSVKLFQNFLWSEDTNDIINRINELKWPRTQDLKKLYEIDSAIFISSKQNYFLHQDRIGVKPLLFVQEGLNSVDIDWEDDFLIAEAIYNAIIKQ